MASLTIRMVPAFLHRRAYPVQTRQIVVLTQPPANENRLEVACVSGREYLPERARVELVHHLAIAVVGGFEGVLFESGVLRERAFAHGCAPFADD